MNIQIKADENAPKDALLEMAKAGILHTLIQKHLHFESGGEWWLQASVKTYLENGKVSGSFYEAIKKIAEEYASQSPLSGEGEKKELRSNAEVEKSCREGEAALSKALALIKKKRSDIAGLGGVEFCIKEGLRAFKSLAAK